MPLVKEVRNGGPCRDTVRKLRRIIRGLTDGSLDPKKVLLIAEQVFLYRQFGKESKGRTVRKGFGVWRDRFGVETRKVLERHVGDGSVLLGYERDDAWVKEE